MAGIAGLNTCSGWLRCVFVATSTVMLAAQPVVAQITKPGIGDGRVSPFYSWNQALPAKPGVLLRSEPLPAELGLSEAGEQKRILYTSTDGVTNQGGLTVSGALFLPKGTPPAGGWPLIAWAHGTVGIADICAPSWSSRSVRDQAYLNAWLKRGYAIVATDYQGLGTPGTHPYNQMRPEAYGVLDSIRAVTAADRRLSRKVVVIGQSQGGGASYSTAVTQPSYAPDVTLLGAVATGTPYIIPSVLTASKTDPNKVDPALAYLFYFAWTASDGADATAFFTPRAALSVNAARTACIFQSESNVTITKLTAANTVQPKPFLGMFVRALPKFAYASLKPNVPLFLGTGTADADVAPAAQRQLVKDSCAAGARIDYHQYEGEDHSGAFLASLKDAEAFVDTLFAGGTVPNTCVSGAVRPA